MKKHATRLMVLAIAAILLLPALCLAKDVKITAEIQSVTKAIDKNGNPYTRFIVPVTRSLNGIEYEVGVAVMAFRTMADSTRSLKSGDMLKAICAEREWNGRTSYTILKVLE